MEQYGVLLVTMYVLTSANGKHKRVTLQRIHTTDSAAENDAAEFAANNPHIKRDELYFTFVPESRRVRVDSQAPIVQDF